MQVFHSRNPARYLFVPQSGPVVLHEFAGCAHLAEGLETIDEIRPAITASYAAAGTAVATVETAWAEQVAGLVREHCGPRAAVGVERVNAGAALALRDQGFHLSDAQAPVERARAVKSTEELKCVRTSVRATEVAVARLRAAMRPGLSENELWSVLHQGVIALGGDYVETRLLSSGPRTNPWFQETGDRRLAENELVALDTDVVGCHGYYCDFSRTFHTGPGDPTRRQRELYRVAHEQVHHNMELLRAGTSFRDYSERAWKIPERFVANRYFVSAHGCGMTGEYPYLYHRMDFEESGYDGVLEPGMTALRRELHRRGEGRRRRQARAAAADHRRRAGAALDVPVRARPARPAGLTCCLGRHLDVRRERRREVLDLSRLIARAARARPRRAPRPLRRTRRPRAARRARSRPSRRRRAV